MKTYLLLFITLFLSSLSIAQETPEEVTCGEALNTYEGIIEDTTSTNPSIDFTNSTVPSVGTIGEMHSISSSSNFTMSIGLGKVKVIAVNGKIATFEIIDAKSQITIDGVKQNSYRRKGQEIKFEEFEYGTKSTVVKKWDSGSIKSKGTLKCGKEIGKWEHFYEDGSKKSVYQFDRKDKLTGKYIEYYKDGQIKTIGYYRDGKKTGTWSTYYDNGKVDSEGYYSNGEKSGKWVEHNSEGKKIKKKY